ncbi:MAG: hypothetical protein P8179_17615 [Candidatus Thiodiazotropha sp.]
MMWFVPHRILHNTEAEHNKNTLINSEFYEALGLVGGIENHHATGAWGQGLSGYKGWGNK